MNEVDPYGTDIHASGAKVDAGKQQAGLFQDGCPAGIGLIADVLTYGAEKYSRNGWKDVPAAKRRYLDAMYRHLNAWHRGEECDTDTDLPHLAHAACNMMFLLEFYYGRIIEVNPDE